MKNINLKKVCSLLRIGLLATVLSMTVVPTTYSGELEMNDEQNAKVARFKARETVAKNKKPMNYFAETEDENVGLDDSSDCGAVDIGNVEQSKPGFGGPKKVDVIITGDIINTGNKCK